MYVRVKRKNQTMFLHVDPSDSFMALKTRIGEVNAVDPSTIALYAKDRVRELVDVATVADQEIENDSIVYMVYQKPNSESFEEIDVPESK
jgi:hypothetical protein